ncbi:MAG: AAA family ATPase [Caulobacteraceae bacterium]|nr:AAA family ATPase [Caulobacteraceae bacterium]
MSEASFVQADDDEAWEAKAREREDREAWAWEEAERREEAADEARRKRMMGENLRPLDVEAFLRLPLPERDFLLDPVFPERGLAMLYAPRGVGKTWAALSIGLAVATGGKFLRWQAQRRRVLYIDGEMRAEDLKHRLALLTAGLNAEVAPGFFRVACADVMETGLPDFATLEGQAEVEPLLHDTDLVILDNLSSIAKGDENEQKRWTPVADWCLAQRRAGRSVLMVHHAGKSGQQRGTSRREDLLDLVIALRRPEGAMAADGARVEVHIEKCRGASGEALDPMEATLKSHAAAALWSWRAVELAEPEPRFDGRAVQPELKVAAEHALLDGLTVAEAAKASGLGVGTVGRLRRAMVEEGRLKGRVPVPHSTSQEP